MQLSINDHHHHIKLKKTGRGRRKLQHLCLDKAYNSKQEEQELIKRGYVLHIPPKRKRDKKEKEEEAKIITQHCSNRKKHSAKRWVEREPTRGTICQETINKV